MAEIISAFLSLRRFVIVMLGLIRTTGPPVIETIDLALMLMTLTLAPEHMLAILQGAKKYIFGIARNASERNGLPSSMIRRCVNCD